MKEERCERCDCIIGLGCGCSSDGAVRKRSPAAQSLEEWRRFSPDAILISPTQYAHVPGACAHLTEELVKPPRWGWIPAPPPGLWDRLSSSHPATATDGNIARQATRRCEDCQATLSSN
jgi:hypothetical protein